MAMGDFVNNKLFVSSDCFNPFEGMEFFPPLRVVFQVRGTCSAWTEFIFKPTLETERGGGKFQLAFHRFSRCIGAGWRRK